jgi:selenide,water dikinase
MQDSVLEPTRLTQYAHGAGCGCKIAPQVLKEIILPHGPETSYPGLLVGNGSNDDAAVYDLGNGTALIATTDFFTPIVDDAYSFGRVAAANAISDVYAMGGTPTLALAILGWPVNTLSPALAAEVLRGARETCREAGIPMAGGHSIDIPEPVFGLSVNGLVPLAHLKRNNTAQQGDLVFLTKELGTGVFSTAQKRNVLEEEDLQTLLTQLIQLNSAGAKIAAIAGVTAMTDVTGFGLLGHLYEMAEGSGLGVELYMDKVPKMLRLEKYLALNTIPDATYRNWNAYQEHTLLDPAIDVMQAFQLLPDPQTNGGLLFSVRPDSVEEVKQLLNTLGLGAYAEPIACMTACGEKRIVVKK